jgi:hypothetical protein
VKGLTNYFEKRMYQRNPFFEEEMKDYNRKCVDQAQIKRQPIILTKKEKEEMDAKFSESSMRPYNEKELLEYGKDKQGDPLYYVCPRYWYAKPGEERVLSQTDVDSGRYGKVIQNPKKPKEDEYIFDRLANPEDNERAKFQYPNFVNSKNATCLPCCFQMSGATQEKNRKMCINNEQPEQDKDALLNRQKDNFIYNEDKKVTEMSEGRYAIVPIAIQSMMKIQESTAKCLDRSKVKDKCTIYIRKAVESHPTQSFLACLAATFYDRQNKQQHVPIRLSELREKLIDFVTLDIFLQAQNGTLVSRFQPKRPQNIDKQKYISTRLYKNLDFQQESQKHFFYSITQSYEEFIRYLKDTNVKIDHTFLWDIVSFPGFISQKGINLIILELQHDDIRSKVNIICPTNYYSSQPYSETRDNLVLYLQDSIYQPIVQYKREYIEAIGIKREVQVVLQFKTLPDFFSTVYELGNSKCSRKTHKITPNWPIDKMHLELRDKIIQDVVNYQGKTVAVMVEYKSSSYYLPCLPSTHNSSVDFRQIYLEDVKWKSFKPTVEFLKAMTERNIPCNPLYSVVENGLIIGILTETNQMVLIDPPVSKEDSLGYKLPFSYVGNLVEADQAMNYPNESKMDASTVLYRKIELEYTFYHSFRSTFRILMSLLKNKPLIEKLHLLRNNTNVSYVKKRQLMVSQLEVIGEPHVLFANIDHNDTELLYQLSNTMGCEENDNSKYCLMTENKTVDNKTLLPEINLITGLNNRTVYYNRLADELIRNERIYLFMFYPEKHMNVTKTVDDYSIASNEVLLPVKMIQKYLKNLPVYKYGNYGTNIGYEDAKNSSQINTLKNVEWPKAKPEQ